MFAFREANERKDAKKSINERVDGVRVVSRRGSMHRRGMDEKSLKSSLVHDLNNLFNSINLHSSEPLDDLPYIRKSVLNFGLEDISNRTSEDHGIDQLTLDLRNNLLNFEPRLREETLEVTRSLEFDDVNQRLRFDIKADIVCRPLDIPIAFVVEVDTGSGKIKLSKLPVSS
jgi:type VI secretion system protein ImpF